MLKVLNTFFSCALSVRVSKKSSKGKNREINRTVKLEKLFRCVQLINTKDHTVLLLKVVSLSILQFVASPDFVRSLVPCRRANNHLLIIIPYDNSS